LNFLFLGDNINVLFIYDTRVGYSIMTDHGMNHIERIGSY